MKGLIMFEELEKELEELKAKALKKDGQPRKNAKPEDLARINEILELLPAEETETETETEETETVPGADPMEIPDNADISVGRRVPVALHVNGVLKEATIIQNG